MPRQPPSRFVEQHPLRIYASRTAAHVVAQQCSPGWFQPSVAAAIDDFFARRRHNSAHLSELHRLKTSRQITLPQLKCRKIVSYHFPCNTAINLSVAMCHKVSKALYVIPGIFRTGTPAVIATVPYEGSPCDRNAVCPPHAKEPNRKASRTPSETGTRRWVSSSCRSGYATMVLEETNTCSNIPIYPIKSNCREIRCGQRFDLRLEPPMNLFLEILRLAMYATDTARNL